MQRSFVIFAAFPAAVAALGAWLSIGGSRKTEVKYKRLQPGDEGRPAGGERRASPKTRISNFTQWMKRPNNYESLQESDSDNEADHASAVSGNERTSESAPAPADQRPDSSGEKKSASAPPPADSPAIVTTEDFMDLAVTKTDLTDVAPNAWMCAIGAKTQLSSKWDATAKRLYYAFGPPGYPTVGPGPIVLPIHEGKPDLYLWPSHFLRSAASSPAGGTNPGGSRGMAGPGRGQPPFFLAGFLDMNTERPSTSLSQKTPNLLMRTRPRRDGRTMASVITRREEYLQFQLQKLNPFVTKLSAGDDLGTLVVYTNNPAEGPLAVDHVAALRTYCEDSSDANKKAVFAKFGGKLPDAMVMALPKMT